MYVSYTHCRILPRIIRDCTYGKQEAMEEVTLSTFIPLFMCSSEPTLILYNILDAKANEEIEAMQSGKVMYTEQHFINASK